MKIYTPSNFSVYLGNFVTYAGLNGRSRGTALIYSVAMRSETIWSRVRERPFKPFGLNTSDGKAYDVSHPEMIHLSKNRIIISVYDKGQKPDEDIPSRDVYVSPLYVASLEDLPEQRRRASA